MHMKLKEPAGLFLIALMKLLSAGLLAAIGFGVFHLLKSDDLEKTAHHMVAILNLDPKNLFINSMIDKLGDVHPSQLKKIGFGTLFYSLLYLIEGIGLLKAKRWAEYMTVIITASLLPIEIIEIIKKVGILKISALIINIIIVIYLIYILSRRRK